MKRILQVYSFVSERALLFVLQLIALCLALLAILSGLSFLGHSWPVLSTKVEAFWFPLSFLCFVFCLIAILAEKRDLEEERLAKQGVIVERD